MSEQGVPIDEVTAKDFIMVRAALVKRLGGANEALVWARIHYRCDEDSRVAHERDGHQWWAAATRVLAAEVGLSGKQVRTALDHLIADGFVVAEQHLLTSNYDRTYSYRCVILPGNIDLPSGANETDLGGESGVPSGANVPIYQTSETGVEKSSHVDDAYSPELRALADRIADMVRANGHPVGTVGVQWWQPLDRLVRLDGFELYQIEIVAKWATSNEFWAGNIRSTSKLRKQFSTLRHQRNAELSRAASKPAPKARAASVIEMGRRMQAAGQGQKAVGQ